MDAVAQLVLERDQNGSVWRLVTTNESIGDLAWQQRDTFLSLGDGAIAFEVVWLSGHGEQVVTRHQPALPQALFD
jgi:hypothetical protein